MSINDIFAAALVFILVLLLARILTRRFREDAKVLLGAKRVLSRPRTVQGRGEMRGAKGRHAPAEGGKRDGVRRARERAHPAREAAEGTGGDIQRTEPPPALSLTQLMGLIRELTPQVRRLVKAGHKTEAVTLIRKRTGMDDDTAKAIVDRFG
jgi:hypothetical protein